MCVFFFMRMYVRMYVCRYLCMYVRMYVCMYVCTYAHSRRGGCDALVRLGVHTLMFGRTIRGPKKDKPQSTRPCFPFPLQSALAATLLGVPYVVAAMPGAQLPPLENSFHAAAS